MRNKLWESLLFQKMRKQTIRVSIILKNVYISHVFLLRKNIYVKVFRTCLLNGLYIKVFYFSYLSFQKDIKFGIFFFNRWLYLYFILFYFINCIFPNLIWNLLSSCDVFLFPCFLLFNQKIWERLLFKRMFDVWSLNS